MSEHPMSETIRITGGRVVDDSTCGKVADELDRLHRIEQAAIKLRLTAGYTTTDLAWVEVDADDYGALVRVLPPLNMTPPGAQNGH